MKNMFWHQNTLDDNPSLKQEIDVYEKKFKEWKRFKNLDEFSVWYSFNGQAILETKKKTDITEYTIRNGSTWLLPYAFARCRNLTKIVFPQTFIFVRHHAFANCSSLDNVVLSEGLKLLDDRAFEYCTSLKTITLPKSLEIVGRDVFKDCKNLQCINVPAGKRSKFCRLFNDIFVMDRICEMQ
jgi:hypothetical protein